MDAQLKTLTVDERTLSVTWSDGRTSRYHYFWLRDNCPQLRHPSTNHRVVETSSLPADVRPASAEITPAGELKIVWQQDGHESRFGPAWLRAYDYSNHCSHANAATESGISANGWRVDKASTCTCAAFSR